MVLVDTSVWIDHFRNGNSDLAGFLDQGKVLCHPYIIGELACGSMKNRSEILALLQSLPSAEIALYEEVLGFIDTHKLMGKGLGYIDIHILMSALLSSVTLWALDKTLASAATSLSQE